MFRRLPNDSTLRAEECGSFWADWLHMKMVNWNTVTYVGMDTWSSVYLLTSFN